MGNQQLDDILNKTSELFLTYGLRSVTMDDISRHMGMSKKTLYQYVKDKADLILKIVMREFERSTIDIANIRNNSQNAIEELFDVSKYMLAKFGNFNPSVLFDLKKYYPNILEELTAQKREFVLNHVISNLNKGKEEGLYREDFNTEIIAKSHTMRLNSQTDKELFTPEERQSPKVFNEIFTYHLRGICSNKGLEYLEQRNTEFKNNK